MRDAVSDRAWLQALLDVEAALARAQARAGLVPAEQAEEIARACRADAFDLAAIGAAAAATGNPVVPLVRALREALPGAAAAAVHKGATSQDVLDSGAMLVAHRALGPLLDDLAAAAAAAAGLAATHRGTVIAGRTLLQQALPVTFGLKAAGWMVGLDEAAARLEELRRTRLAVQLGGAAGTLAALGQAGVEVLGLLAGEVGLAEPVMPWHTVRTRVAELAGALGAAAGVVGKAARDVTLLAQTEVAEVRERGPAGRGGSSTLPHKRNPVAAVAALACAEQAPGLVATLLAAMVQEHERAAGAWHAEWRPLTDLLRATGSAAAWLRDCLERLEVDPERMRRNLDATGGLLLAERVTAALVPGLGRIAAQELVQQASGEALEAGRPLAAVLRDRPEVADLLDPEEVERLLDPTSYLGNAEAFVDRALRARRADGQAGVPGTPLAPSTPEAPRTAETPGVPRAPGVPRPNTAHQTPGTPVRPGMPETPGAPRTAGTPDPPVKAQPPGTPLAPETPETPGAPRTARTPDPPEPRQAVGTARTPATPGQSGAPQTPGTPGRPQPPGSPQPPGTPRESETAGEP